MIVCFSRYIFLSKVMECTDYADKRLPCVEDMEEIAWRLRTKKAGTRAGFLVGLETNDSQRIRRRTR